MYTHVHRSCVWHAYGTCMARAGGPRGDSPTSRSCGTQPRTRATRPAANRPAAPSVPSARSCKTGVVRVVCTTAHCVARVAARASGAARTQGNGQHRVPAVRDAPEPGGLRAGAARVRRLRRDGMELVAGEPRRGVALLRIQRAREQGAAGDGRAAEGTGRLPPAGPLGGFRGKRGAAAAESVVTTRYSCICVRPHDSSASSVQS